MYLYREYWILQIQVGSQIYSTKLNATFSTKKETIQYHIAL